MTFERESGFPKFPIESALTQLKRYAHVETEGKQPHTVLTIHPHNEEMAERAVGQVATLLSQRGRAVTVRDRKTATAQTWIGQHVIDAKVLEKPTEMEKPTEIQPRWTITVHGEDPEFADILRRLLKK